jgi:hypothetical protein
MDDCNSLNFKSLKKYNHVCILLHNSKVYRSWPKLHDNINKCFWKYYFKLCNFQENFSFYFSSKFEDIFQFQLLIGNLIFGNFLEF